MSLYSPGSSVDSQGQKGSDIEVAIGWSHIVTPACHLPPSAHWTSINVAPDSRRTYCQLQPYACFACSATNIPALAWVGLRPTVPCSQACTNPLWGHFSRSGWTMFLSQEGIRGPHWARAGDLAQKTPPFQLGRKEREQSQQPGASWRNFAPEASYFLSFCWWGSLPSALSCPDPETGYLQPGPAGAGGQAGMTGTWLPAQVAPLTSPPTQVAQWPLRAPSFLDGLVCSAVNRAGKQSCPGKFWNWRGLREADPTWGGGYWVPPSLLSLLPFKLIPHTAWPSLPQGELWALLNPAYRPKGQRKQPERAPMGQGWDTVSNKRISNYNSFIKWISTKPTQLEINNWINKGGQLFLMEEF